MYVNTLSLLISIVPLQTAVCIISQKNLAIIGPGARMQLSLNLAYTNKDTSTVQVASAT